MDKKVENKETGVVNDEQLSKAIDELIEENFGKSEEGEKKELEKAEQPENKMDELPKDEDVKANGGKDVIKAKKVEKAEEEKAEEEKEEEEEEGEEMEKKAKKSEQEGESELETLRKSLAGSQERSESLQKSFESLEKAINKKFEDIGEIFKGMKYEIDELKKSPMPRKSIKSVDQLSKSFDNSGDEEESGESFNKSEVERAIEDLVKSGQCSSSVMSEYEVTGKIMHPHHRSMVSHKIVENRKKKD